ncbi:MAG TPA: hypothetical protein VJ932_06505, partial [Alkalispirochaeta sp.]|nr:hypothetical protein [Alkalispirochaeta sp.]
GQLFGGTGGEVQGAVRYQPQLWEQAHNTITMTTASLHVGRRTGWIHFEPMAAVATNGSGAARENLPWRASPFNPEGRHAIITSDSAVLGRLAVAAAAPPLDIAWRGFSLHHIGARGYVSQAALGSDTFTSENYTVAGAELQLHGQFNLIPLEVTTGVAIRLPHGVDAGSRRVQFYFNLGGAAVDQVSDRFVTP